MGEAELMAHEHSLRLLHLQQEAERLKAVKGLVELEDARDTRRQKQAQMRIHTDTHTHTHTHTRRQTDAATETGTNVYTCNTERERDRERETRRQKLAQILASTLCSDFSKVHVRGH